MALALPGSPVSCDSFVPPCRLSGPAARSANQPIGYLMEKALQHPELISLAAGFVDQHSLPVDAYRQATATVLGDPVRGRMALQYGTTFGYGPLREALLHDLVHADGTTGEEINLAVDQVVVTAGSNQLLYLLSEILFEPGDIVLCTSPTYFVYLGVLRALGVRAIGVETDEKGLVPESLASRLAALEASGELPRVKAIYVVSYFDNPGGVTLSLERRPKIVELARKYSRDQRIHVLEDAAYRELRYAGEDLPSMRSFDTAGDTVIHLGTFSKSFSPGVRIGWGFLPKHLVHAVSDVKGIIDFGSPNFAQHAMSEVLAQGLYRPQIERLREAYRAKLQAMLAAADRHLAGLPGVSWLRPTGGLYVWLTLPEHVDTGLDGRLFALAMEEGILYVPGEYGYPADGRAPQRNTLRLSFGVQTPERIAEGMAALGRAVRRVLAE